MNTKNEALNDCNRQGLKINVHQNQRKNGNTLKVALSTIQFRILSAAAFIVSWGLPTVAPVRSLVEYLEQRRAAAKRELFTSKGGTNE